MIPEELPGSEPPVKIDRCPGCRGLWFEPGEVTYAFPALEPLLRGRVSALERPSGIACACGGALVVFAVASVSVDVCPRCFALWLDGADVDDLTRAIEAAQRPAGEGIYRGASGSQIPPGHLQCPACQAVVPLASTMRTEDGPLCDRCFQARPR